MAVLVQSLDILNHRLRNCRCNLAVEMNRIQKHIIGTIILIMLYIVNFKISLAVTIRLKRCDFSVPTVVTSPNDVRVFGGSKNIQS